MSPRRYSRRFFIYLSTLGAVVILTLFAVALYIGYQGSRESISHAYTVTADLVAEQSTAPLLFEEIDILEQKLKILHNNPDVAMACVYNANDHLIAGYSAVQRTCPPLPADAATTFEITQANVIWQDTFIGHVQLHTHATDLQDLIVHVVQRDSPSLIPVLLLTLFLLLGISYLLAWRATRPLALFTDAVRNLQPEQHAISIADTSSVEVNELNQAFNAMMEERDAEKSRATDAMQNQLQAVHERAQAFRILQTVLNQLPHPIFAVSPDGMVLFANQAVADLYGTTPAQLRSPEFFAGQMGKEDQLLIGQEKLCATEGLEVWFDSDAGETRRLMISRLPTQHPPAMVTVALDLTDQHRLQTQLQFSQRLEVLGTLAGGIAHDFNNLLTPILGYTSMLESTDLPTSAAEKVTVIRNAAEKARDLVQQILTFSRQQEQKPGKQPVLLQDAVHEVVRLMKATVPPNITFQFELEALPPVAADPGQIHQVLVNLCTNAAQAIGTNQGTIRIMLRATSASDGSAPGQLPGDRVALIVEDDGPGIPASVIDHVFEPFFTTKDVGKGSGLGLSVAHGIVAAHGGEISVSSTPGATRFTVCLPAAQHSEATPIVTAPEWRPAHGQQLMLVDDEETVLRAMTDILRHEGYEVSAFSRPEDALNAFSAAPEKYWIVITDGRMPELNGHELAQRLRRLSPQLPMVLITGYQHSDLSPAPLFDASLEKPINLNELTQTIEALKRRAA